MSKSGMWAPVIRRSEAASYILVPALVFADILNNGSLNLLYFAAVLLIFMTLWKRTDYYRDLLLYFVPFALLPFLYFLCSGRALHMVKAAVYCTKIFLCVSLLSFFKHSPGNGFQPEKVWTGTARCFFLFLALSLLFYAREPLWRVNDAYNSFSRTRLQFLYSEPSVLGLITGVLLLFTLHGALERGFSGRRLLRLALLALILLLTFSMSGLLYFAVSSAWLLASWLLRSGGRVKKSLLALLLAAGALAVLILATANPISGRLASILQGSDSSFHFRWEASLRSLAVILRGTGYWGLGLGGMNTEAGLQLLLEAGMDYKFANSFLYVIAENGWMGALYLLYLTSLCFHSVKAARKREQARPKAAQGYREKAAYGFRLKEALFLYVFISQIAGGYFTDPLLWCMYGIICGKE